MNSDIARIPASDHHQCGRRPHPRIDWRLERGHYNPRWWDDHQAEVYFPVTVIPLKPICGRDAGRWPDYTKNGMKRFV
jgi:hypothetical protein